MTERLTVAQALWRFLAAQHVDGRRFFHGVLGVFGHGNVAGLGQALAEHGDLPYRMSTNEQAMVHTAAAYARAERRRAALVCTTSIGPGATNLVTGAAGATVNRLPVLLLPGDAFATHRVEPVLQQLEHPRTFGATVNDCLKPVSKFWARIDRPEQLPAAVLTAMRVLTDPAETGAVTIALPQDVQVEWHDWPSALFEDREWRIPAPQPDRSAIRDAARLLRAARRPVIVAGGGVVYAGVERVVQDFAVRRRIPVLETQAGKGVTQWECEIAAGPVGVTGSSAANELAARADLVLGIGTRFSDFTTASGTLFADLEVRFVTVNVAAADAAKAFGPGYAPDRLVSVVSCASTAVPALDAALDDWMTPAGYAEEYEPRIVEWRAEVDAARTPVPGRLTQASVIAAVNDACPPLSGTVVCAAGSMPGDLHKLWRAWNPAGYHVEYGYSCMGYEIAGGIGVALADPEREVFVLVGDGSYLMLGQELAMASAYGIGLVVVLVDNGGYASIGDLSARVGGRRLGTAYPVAPVPWDLGANAESLGAKLFRAETFEELIAALAAAREVRGRPSVVHVRTSIDRATEPVLDSGVGWEVPLVR
jgi:3D-(3,5/4)-trihydroxycyclohexane-1,2-dione acylhydrolase (decyclizing)